MRESIIQDFNGNEFGVFRDLGVHSRCLRLKNPLIAIIFEFMWATCCLGTMYIIIFYRMKFSDEKLNVCVRCNLLQRTLCDEFEQTRQKESVRARERKGSEKEIFMLQVSTQASATRNF